MNKTNFCTCRGKCYKLKEIVVKSMLFFTIRLEHGKTHSINIPAIDNDDDSLECEFSIYVEAGKFRDIVKNLTGLGILTMNKLV